MASTPAAREITRRYQTALARLRTFLEAQLAVAWAANDGLDDDTLNAWLAASIPLATSATERAAVVSDAYVAAFLRAEGIPATPVGIDPSTQWRPGVTSADLWARPIIASRIAISKGADYADARNRGLRRALDNGSTDVTLASRGSVAQSLDAQQTITRYQRVLTGRESCVLCQSASGKTYSTGTLLPIHHGCDCTVEPIVEGRKQLPRRETTVKDSPGLTEAAEDGAPVIEEGDDPELGPVLLEPRIT